MKLAILVFVAALLAACTVVTPQWAAKFDVDAANARAFDKLVQADSTASPAIKRWSAADAVEWTATSDWANRRAPATQP